MKFIKYLLLITAMPALLSSCSADDPPQMPQRMPESYYNHASTDDGVLRVLAIGNSFSKAIVESYLHNIFDSEHISVELGNMHISSCSLKQHMYNAANNAHVYEYWNYLTDYEPILTDQMSLHEVLTSQAWDYITLQQVSSESGMYETIDVCLDELIPYIKARVPSDTKILWHQTWAYGPNSDHQGFSNYHNDQITMYRAIANASYQVMENYPFEDVIPAGTAIQNARATELGNDLTQDGSHLDTPLGKYIGACTWFQTLTGIDVRAISYRPSNMSAEQAEICRTAASNAVANPYTITK